MLVGSINSCSISLELLKQIVIDDKVQYQHIYPNSSHWSITTNTRMGTYRFQVHSLPF